MKNLNHKELKLVIASIYVACAIVTVMGYLNVRVLIQIIDLGMRN